MRRASEWMVMVGVLLSACASNGGTPDDRGPPDEAPREDPDAGPPDAPPARGVKLQQTGAGEGELVAMVAGEACDEACLAALLPGTELEVRVTVAPGSWFRGWVTGCSGRHECEIAASDGLVITGELTPEPNRIFLSSVTHDGAFGGLEGGDALCQGLADQAQLGGTYRILLSTSTEDWLARTAGARGWIRVDGEPFADQMLAETIGMYNNRLTEYGRDRSGGGYWSYPRATFAGGTHCQDWTSQLGGDTNDKLADFSTTTQVARSLEFPRSGRDTCATKHPFACAQVDRVVPVTPIARKGRLAFMSYATWSASTGIERADQLCASEAKMAKKPGSFKAVLATSTASAISRFRVDGPPWVRADGLPLLPTAEDLTTATMLDIAPGMHATREVHRGYGALFLGAPNLYTPGTWETTCHDWSTSSALTSGFSPDSTHPAQLQMGCHQWQLLCLEE